MFHSLPLYGIEVEIFLVFSQQDFYEVDYERGFDLSLVWVSFVSEVIFSILFLA